ncbi:MAG TPA: glycosyltransferase family 4 protein [Candidatus Limnocylindria bacterium]
MNVLIVVQRYGDEVVGGSESHARTVATRLARTHRVEVATTTALDFWTWAPHYAAGTTEVNGVTVHRFPVQTGRRPDFKAFEQRVLFADHTLADELAWPGVQGPNVPELYDFLHDRGRRYDALLFYTYIYAPTALGLPIVPERAALVPTAHDERPLELAPYGALFHLPRAIGYLTPEERSLVHRRFRNEEVPDVVLGVALDPPAPGDAAAFRARQRIAGRLVVYLGQVTEGKGCDELLSGWAAYRASGGDGTLVLAGTIGMDLSARPDVLALGRVSDAEKADLLAAADVLVQPSHLESLGITLLEAWQVATPVLVPRWNAVTAGQVGRSGGGRTYASLADFPRELAALLDGEGRSRGEAGRRWVERECGPDAFDARLAALLDLVVAGA